MNEKQKRIISLGFNKVEKLEGNTIYIDIGFSLDTKQPCAVAYSNNQFTYHLYSIGGDRLTQNSNYCTTATGDINRDWETNYNIFIEDIVKSNDAEIGDNKRLLEDGSKLVEIITRTEESLKNIIKPLKTEKRPKSKITL